MVPMHVRRFPKACGSLRLSTLHVSKALCVQPFKALSTQPFKALSTQPFKALPAQPFKAFFTQPLSCARAPHAHCAPLLGLQSARAQPPHETLPYADFSVAPTAAAAINDTTATATASAIASDAALTLPSASLASSERELVSEMTKHVRNGAEEPFFLIDLGAAYARVALWRAHLPRVEPFYAVKCNPDLALLSLFASLGVNFDCASRAEMQAVFSVGVPAERVVYANPCKQPSHLRFARDNGVALSVFDSEAELVKTAAAHPSCELLLRIKVDDSKAQCVMSDKYGAPLSQAASLLAAAATRNVRVRGVSFHVGSGCYSPTAFVDAIAHAAHVFDIAADFGAPMDVLDIGGGFPGSDTPELAFSDIAAAIRPALDAHFPESRNVRIIAEPGRFLAAKSHTLAVNIIGKKTAVDATGERHTMYYVNDGLYGSFNNVVYDHAVPEFKVLPEENTTGLDDTCGGVDGTYLTAKPPLESCSIWGPTCDGFDCIVKSTRLPDLEVGRWLYFPEMGAYTSAAGSTFNGMPAPDKHFVARAAEDPFAVAAAAFHEEANEPRAMAACA